MFICGGQGVLERCQVAASIEKVTPESLLVNLAVGGNMEAGDREFRDPVEKEPVDVLRRFVDVFVSKGRLNQTLRIKHRGRRYRIFCSERKFFAYQINDHYGVSWGFPGWPVCIVTPDQIIDDSEMSVFSPTEPSVNDWLRCIADEDFEII